MTQRAAVMRVHDKFFQFKNKKQLLAQEFI
jgi:hypothetical protein